MIKVNYAIQLISHGATFKQIILLIVILKTTKIAKILIRQDGT